MKRTYVFVLMVAISLGILAPNASANGPHEINDYKYQARLVKLNTLYGTTLETSNDRDWFRFKINRRTQINISVLLYGFVDQCQAQFELFNRSGREIGSKQFDVYSDERPQRQIRKTLGSGTYYLQFRRTTLFGERCPQGSFLFAVKR